MTKTREKLLFSYFFVTFSLLSGSTPKVTFSLLFRYFDFFGVSGSVGPFAPHNPNMLVHKCWILPAQRQGGINYEGFLLEWPPLQIAQNIFLVQILGGAHFLERRRWNVNKKQKRGFNLFGDDSDRFLDLFSRFSTIFASNWILFGSNFVLQTCHPNFLNPLSRHPSCDHSWLHRIIQNPWSHALYHRLPLGKQDYIPFIAVEWTGSSPNALTHTHIPFYPHRHTD